MNNINPISTPPFASAGEVSLNKNVYKTVDVMPTIPDTSELVQQEQPVQEAPNTMSVLPPIIGKKFSQPMSQPSPENAQAVQQQNISTMDNTVITNNPASKLFGKGGLLNAVDEGGTHEQNPLGGVPMGKGTDGVTNFVEQGETSFNIKGQKFIFSNRITI